MRPSTSTSTRLRPPQADTEEDDPFDFPDLPDSFSDQNQPTPSSSRDTSQHIPSTKPGTGPGTIKNLSSTIMGSGPNGIGIITKLNTKAKPSTISKGSIKLKAKAVARVWEDELDFEDEGDGDWGKKLSLAKGLGGAKVPTQVDGLDLDEDGDEDGDWRKMVQGQKAGPGAGTGGPKLGLGLPRKVVMPEADTLDDLGFDLDEEDGDTIGKKGLLPPARGLVLPPNRNLPGPDALDDLDAFDDIEDNPDEATLKAGATIKALLPPPRIRPSPSPAPLPTASTAQLEAEDEDADFALPLNLTNLTLATRTSSHAGRPRTSIASNNTDWNSPTTSSSTSTGKKTDGWDSTPSKRFSETSGTSISDGLASHYKSVTRPGVNSNPSLEEEEDMEEGLILPSKHFFKSTSKRELDSLLDRKRRPEYATTSNPAYGYASPTRSSGHVHDLSLYSEGLEDGLVFEDPKAELTRKRLTKSKEARSQIPIPTRRSSPIGKGSSSIFGVAKPSPYSIRERTQSNVGLTGHRSHSTGNTSIMPPSAEPSGSGSGSGFKPFSPTRPRSPTSSAMFSPTAAKERSRSGQAFVPMRIIPPKTPSKSGLRHQKSSSHLPSPSSHSHSHSQVHAPPTPGLTRKQSLASLQDAPIASHSQFSSNSTSSLGNQPLHSLAEEPNRAYATSSSSRLTNPTSASKAKARPPLSGVFPVSTSGLTPTPSAGTSASTRSRLLHAQMKRRPYGDGTELEAIADLEVGEGDGDQDKKDSWPKTGSSSSRSKGSTRDRPSLRSVFSPEKKTKSSNTGSGSLSKAASVAGYDGREKESRGKEKEKEGSWGRRKGKRAPLLIKHLGTVDKKKVVGEMTWNPIALRWEGNESALREFDNVPAPSGARPALITAPAPDSPTSTSHTASGTVRIVGNMQFDPKEMRWICLDPEDEIDPFEGMADADDEDEERGGTIRASARNFRPEMASVSTASASEASSTRHVSGFSTSFATAMGLVSEELRGECREAEERHRREMRGWQSGTGGSWSRSEERREEKRLWEIRHLAQVVGG